MAAVTLAQPAAGQHVVISDMADARFILNFATDQATLERSEDGNSLLFKFEDGSSIELQNFYTQFTKENMPEFEIEGQSIA
ncbi:MAG: hypothetical protein IJU76_09220, partial [Desulfovibrionaceae bacterium]|nr:hypothetical protein [Desulfovibrionaceae bacterium]